MEEIWRWVNGYEDMNGVQTHIINDMLMTLVYNQVMKKVIVEVDQQDQ